MPASAPRSSADSCNRGEPEAVPPHRKPDMPSLLTNDLHIMVPLEPTYQAAWEASPEDSRVAVETGVLPEAG